MYDYVKNAGSSSQTTYLGCVLSVPLRGSCKEPSCKQKQRDAIREDVDFQERGEISISTFAAALGMQAKKLNPAEEWFLALCFAQEAYIKCGHCGLISIRNPRCGESHLPGPESRFFARADKRRLMVFLLNWVIASNELFGATHSTVARRSCWKYSVAWYMFRDQNDPQNQAQQLENLPVMVRKF